ncbi:MAG: zinc-dependent metalloprotease [Rubrivivax sp.]
MNVVREAKRIDGPIVMWQKDEKVWFELTPQDFGRAFLLSPKIKSGIGEAWVLGGLMAYPVNGAGGAQLVEFVRVHNTVRLQARNTDVIAPPGTPEARAVADSYSNSLLGVAGVASQPHPERKSILVEANSYFMNDIVGVGMMLQRAFRQGYSLDRGNSTITAARSSKEAVILETSNHFYTGSIATLGFVNVPLGGSGPSVPRFLPDARSMLVGLHYSLAPLPEKPMATRAADPRLGLFTSTRLDFGNDLALSPRQRMVNRWRLEKKDPAAALSEPVKPITFWIDRNVPLAYRDTVRAAILEWNKAFERIGFKNALVVQQQSDDATFDTLDFGVASVRWMMNAEPSFGAIGPSHVDPRSGEILDADIAFEGLSARAVRGIRTQVLGAMAATAGGASLAGLGLPALPEAGATSTAAPASFAAPFALPGLETAMTTAQHDHRLCQYSTLAAEQLGYALDVLEARGDIDPESAEAQQFVLDYVKDALMHEVGHALGLRHNFRASRVYTEEQLSDPEFTRTHGTTGSVMEYNAVNLPRPGQRGGTPFMTTLGPYDYWAVEYAYKPPAPNATAAQEREMLQAIAARSNEPLLAYGTDEDAWFGIDPETIQLDLGNDPVVFAAKRVEIARDLFRRQETRELSPQRDYAVLRRSLNYALGDAARAVGVLVRQIGGVRTLRDYPGSGRDPLLPVPASVQRAALDTIANAVLAADGLKLSAPLQRRLAPDYMERAEIGAPTDYSLPGRLFELQRAVLAYLMSEWIAQRVLDSVGKFDHPAEAFQLRELYDRLAQDVWSELKTGAPITPARRELQREHLNRLALMALRPASRVDARAVLRDEARTLLPRLDAAARRPGLDADTRAHLADSAETLRRALVAPLPRLGL